VLRACTCCCGAWGAVLEFSSFGEISITTSEFGLPTIRRDTYKKQTEIDTETERQTETENKRGICNRYLQWAKFSNQIVEAHPNPFQQNRQYVIKPCECGRLQKMTILR